MARRAVASGSAARMGTLGASALLAATLAACAPNTGVLVRFPLGDVQRGREAFVALECHSCHRLDGSAIPAHPNPSATSIVLGGHTPRIESFGDIITAIVNPSHRLAADYRAMAGRGAVSPMAAEFLNEVMTTQQLVDIAALLHREYDYIPPPPAPYWESYGGGDDPFDWGR